MFNLSGSELIFLVVIALVVLGPDKLPDAMRRAGKAYADFKKMTTGFQNEMKNVLEEPMRELRETADLAKKAAMWDVNSDTKPVSATMAPAPVTPASPAEGTAAVPDVIDPVADAVAPIAVVEPAEQPTIAETAAPLTVDEQIAQLTIVDAPVVGAGEHAMDDTSPAGDNAEPHNAAEQHAGDDEAASA